MSSDTTRQRLATRLGFFDETHIHRFPTARRPDGNDETLRAAPSGNPPRHLIYGSIMNVCIANEWTRNIFSNNKLPNIPTKCVFILLKKRNVIPSSAT